MNTLKSVLGAGGSKKDEAGQEPISGEQGKGTAGQPFDAGNQEGDSNLAGKAPQHTNANETPVLDKSGQEPVSGEQGKGTATQPFDAGNQQENPDLAGKAPADGKSSDRLALPTANGTAGDAKFSPKLFKAPTIGSSRWFANPFTKDKESNTDGGNQAANGIEATATSAPAEEVRASSGAEESTTRPPNHLGSDVPPGQHTIVVDSTPTTSIIDPAFEATGNLPNHLGSDVPPGLTQQADGKIDKGKGKAKVTDTPSSSEPSPAFTDSSTASNRSTRRESGSTDYTAATRNTFSSFTTSVAGSSRSASGNVHIVHSQGKPIMAGGVPLGLPAMQERERRFSSAVPSFYREDEETNAAPVVDEKLAVPAPTTTTTQQTTIAPTTKEQNLAPPPSDPAAANDGKPRRRSSVIMKAKNLGRRMRHSIAH